MSSCITTYKKTPPPVPPRTSTCSSKPYISITAQSSTESAQVLNENYHSIWSAACVLLLYILYSRTQQSRGSFSVIYEPLLFKGPVYLELWTFSLTQSLSPHLTLEALVLSWGVNAPQTASVSYKCHIGATPTMVPLVHTGLICTCC